MFAIVDYQKKCENLVETSQQKMFKVQENSGNLVL